MKLVNAIPGMGMNMTEVEAFLESRLNVQLATIDEAGDPNIQPLWFHYDKNTRDLYIMTPRMAKKMQNIRDRPTVYFSIDDESLPYKGVKGKGTVTVIEERALVVPGVERINMKYLGTLDHPIAKRTMENARNGNQVLLKIRPHFFSTWDFGKAQ
jgi:general stress protein 26